MTAGSAGGTCTTRGYEEFVAMHLYYLSALYILVLVGMVI